MTEYGILTLIGHNPETHGAFATFTEVRRNVYVTALSVGRTEMYHAMAQGLQPEYVFRLEHDFEYHKEPECEYNGIRYKVIRAYKTQTDGIELTVQRDNHVTAVVDSASSNTNTV